MVTTNIIKIYENGTETKQYLKIVKDQKSQMIVLLKNPDNSISVKTVYLKEATVKKNKENKEEVIQKAIASHPDRVFAEPDGKTIGMLVYSKLKQPLPKTIDSYQYMDARECFNWLLLKQIGL